MPPKKPATSKNDPKVFLSSNFYSKINWMILFLKMNASSKFNLRPCMKQVTTSSLNLTGSKYKETR